MKPGNSPRLLRTMNEQLLLRQLRDSGAASRADLAKITRLSKPTVSAALAGLEEDGLVHLVGEVAGRPGPVPSLYDMNTRAACVAGIDIGRDWIRVAIADLRGHFIGRSDGRNSARSAAELVRRVRALADEAAVQASLDWSTIACSVVGSPGVFDPKAGRLAFAPNLPGWGRAGLVDRLKTALGVEMAIENDINLAAVGEHAHGEGQGRAHFVLVSIGTGVGMGIVINGSLYAGARGAAGEVSFLPTPEDSVGDRAVRQHGATEAVASARGVARTARAAGLHVGSAKEVFEAAARGDRKAAAVVSAEGRRIGALIVAVAAVLDPEVVVLSGGVGRNLELLGAAIEERIAEIGPLRPAVVASALGDSGVLLGAIERALARAWDLIFARRDG